MRCQSCDKILNDYESTRKSAVTGEYIDLCNACFATIKDSVYVKERIDLQDISDIYDGYDEEDVSW